MPTTPFKATAATLGLLLTFCHAWGADLTTTDIGNPTVAGSMTSTAGGYNIVGGGTNIFGTSDQFFFAYQEITGDFDYRTRISSLSLSDIWAKSGLMARETLVSTGRHASVFATPNVSGTFFSSRSTVAGVTANIGSFPTAYPNTWVRLKRVGSDFTG